MIVASCATNGEAKHSGAGRSGHIIEFVIASTFELLFGELGRKDSGTHKTGGHHSERVGWCDFVAGQLPADELIPRHIGVKGLDDKVAVVVGKLTVVVLLEAMAFGKASSIEPVACPALAIMRTSKKFVDKFGMWF